MTTIKDVAKRAGVAISTASLALNHSDRVSKDTAEKVLKAAQELQYRKNGWARDLKMKKTMMIGLVLHDLSGSFYASIIKGIERTLHSHGYGLIACSTLGENLGTAERFLHERRVDGVIVFSEDVRNETLLEVCRDDFPVVIMDRELSHPNLYSVVANNQQGGYIAAQHLLELGHTNIGYISGPTNNRDSQLRIKGFEKCLLEKLHAPIPAKWHVKGDYSQQGGYQAAKLLAKQPTLPTAVFVSNDEMAFGAIQAFHEEGLNIPNDISLIGFDDILLAAYVQPSLTTIRQPQYEMGALAAHHVLQHIQGESPTKQAVLDTTLIPRQSTIEIGN